MGKEIKRIFIEKKKGYDIEAQELLYDLKENLGIKGLAALRVIYRYDIAGISDLEYQKARMTIFAEPPVDDAYDENISIQPEAKVFAVEYLPGQYDQRADSAAQCLQILAQGEKPQVRVAKVLVLEGKITEAEYEKIKGYCINAVEAREASLKKPLSLDIEAEIPDDIEVVTGFILRDVPGLKEMSKNMGFAMDLDDLKFCQTYFRDAEKRDPTITELRMIDTYWSDHCRHTTFLTNIDKVEFEEGKYSDVVKSVYNDYLSSRKFVYGDREKAVCLMDIATIGMKELKKRGQLCDLDESEEINACSIVVEVDVNGENQEWLIMFKNETHNHPTEIEPFGGAATCLGGAIRDPLSGRAYVYQAMRVTGSGDPRTRVEDTIQGKLPQRKITTTAASGYSSYGNQIGLTTGHVSEIYDEGYVAKRMELGAVIAAAPKKNVVRKTPMPGDVVILLGGRTGRDGCGGATGSSKAHTEESLDSCGAEVQKGNAPEERKIQRLFRKTEVTRMIKRCNDFGAGGVSVAIGELADGLRIDLDKVPKKYEGLDGTELAISESQERMAVVIAKEDVQAFINAAQDENLEATVVAAVTEEKRLQMFWRGRLIVDISRTFLNSNGTEKYTEVLVKEPKLDNYFNVQVSSEDVSNTWIEHLKDLNICSQKGLIERFDSTIGAGTVLSPLGGKYQLTPAESMVAKVPVLEGDTNTGTVMSYGYDPKIAKWSPFHGAVYAIVEAIAKVVAVGGDYRKIRLTLQEYFKKLGTDSYRWGKPFSALLGAYYVQNKLGIPSIGGKDSMSGSFMDLDVPPTLVAFAVGVLKVDKVISNEFKHAGSTVVYLPLKRDIHDLPDFEQLDKNYIRVHELIAQQKIRACHTVRGGGLAEVISKMCFGNNIGFEFADRYKVNDLFAPTYGSLVLELGEGVDAAEAFKGIDHIVLGHTKQDPVIMVNGMDISLDAASQCWQQPLESIFPTRVAETIERSQPKIALFERKGLVKAATSFAKPRVFIPVFPGTNCEYDLGRAFEKAGGTVVTDVFRNLVPSEIEQSLKRIVKQINSAQIVVIPGGFSAGDEPGGSGKFIATVFRNAAVRDAIMNMLNQRDGLMIGICNGFQALIKLGLVPHGKIREMDESSPTLTFNTIGRHVSRMVQTKVISTLSPWFSNVKAGDIHTIAVSHGEGRFVASEQLIKQLAQNGQIATQYVDFNGDPTYDMQYNPNGSMAAIEGITSPDGRILGKMAHSERIGTNVFKNIPGQKDQKIFEAGVSYFK